MNSQDNRDENLTAAAELIQSAAGDGAKLVVLPEYSNYLSDEARLEHAETLDGPTMSFFSEQARTHNIYLHCGSIIEQSEEPSKAYNTSVLLNPKGEIVACYRKIHLFDLFIPGQVDARESKHLKPGNKAVAKRTELGTFGMTICYDMRFPELYRKLTDQGANLIFVPSAFTLYTGKDHWEPLLRTRAIENLIYIVAPAQFGVHPKNKRCFGSSMIIDPWGTVIAKASEGVGYTIANVNWRLQKSIRQKLQALNHRVPIKD